MWVNLFDVKKRYRLDDVWLEHLLLPARGDGGPASAETGTVMRPDTLRAYAREAGFKSVEILPIENYFFRFYRLIP